MIYKNYHGMSSNEILLRFIVESSVFSNSFPITDLQHQQFVLRVTIFLQS
jgi:hypothetical protein